GDIRSATVTGVQTCAPPISRRALRPQRADQIQPARQSLTEFARTRILGASQLAHETEIPEQRNPLLPFRSEAPVRQPREEIKSRDRKSTRLNSSHVSISYAV